MACQALQHRAAILVLAACLLYSHATAQEPLHTRIDQIVESAHVGPQVPIADDLQFLRRIYLDLTGSIPSSTKAREFLADMSTDKRAKVVDELLNSPAFVRHMAKSFDLMLMERRPDKHVKSPEWMQYLTVSLEQNKPYNQLAAEILGADGVDAKLRAPAKFYLDRDVEPNLVTRELGRVFFGMDLECAQCHDHPLINDYYQSDYYGIFAFINRSYVFQPDTKKPAVIAEKAEGGVQFKSVFTQEEGTTRPRLPGSQQIDEPTFAKGQEYKVKADPKKKNIRPIPNYSRRSELAKRATDGTNHAFNRNIVNRLWAHMMGRGLVHPVDLHHAKNAPSHPKLLEMLAADFVAMKFDIKMLLREFALSRTYQRSFRLPDNLERDVESAKQQLAAAQTKIKEREQAIERLTQELEKLQTDVATAEKTAAPLLEQLKKANDELAAAQKAADDANKALADAKNQLAQKQKTATPLAEAAAKASQAAKQLAGDKELADLVAKIQAKSNRITGEVAALTKSVTEKTAATTTATEKVNAAKKPVDEAMAKATPVKQLVESQRKALETAKAKLSADKKSVAAAEDGIGGIGLYVAHAEKLAALRPALSNLHKIESDLSTVRQTLRNSEAQKQKTEEELAAAQKAHDEAAKVAADVKGKLAKHQEDLKVATEEAAKAVAAAANLPADSEAAKAAADKKARFEQLTKELAEVKKTAATREAELVAVVQRRDTAKKSIHEATAAIASSQQQIKALEQQHAAAIGKFAPDQAALEETAQALSEHWTKKFSLAALDQLTPEQMAWSVMQATGLTDRQRIASTAEVDKKSPLKPEEKNDAAKVAARAKQIDQAVFDKLKGNETKFVQLFGPGAGQPQHEFFATVDQALFFANGGELRGWLASGGGNLADRLMKIDDSKSLAEELYLSVLTRLPDENEVASVAQYLASRPKEKSAVVQEMVWALITSAEFRFNH